MRKSRYLYYISIFLLLFVVACFSLKVIVHPERLERYTIPVTIHGLFMLSWFIFFVVQTRLVLLGRISKHKEIGKAGSIILAGMLISAIPVMINLYNEFHQIGMVIFNGQLFVFIIAIYILAVRMIIKGKADWHKRLMLLVTLSMTGQAFGRLCNILNIHEVNALPMQLVLMIALMLGYDITSKRKVHKATVTGFLAFVLSTFLAVAVVYVISPEELG